MDEAQRGEILKANTGLALSIVCMALGVSASLGYLAILVPQVLGTTPPRLPSVDDWAFWLTINGLCSGFPTLMLGGSVLLSRDTRKSKRAVFLAVIGITLGLFGIIANLWVLHFIASGDY